MEIPVKVLGSLGFASILLIAVRPADTAGSQKAKFYEGVITVTTKAAAGDMVYDEATTLAEFKLRPIEIGPDREDYETVEFTVTSRVLDRSSDGSLSITFGPKSYPIAPGHVGITLVIDRKTMTYRLSVGTVVLPDAVMTNALGSRTVAWMLGWADPGDKNPLSGDRVVNGECERVIDGLPTRMTWVLTRRLRSRLRA